MINQRALVTLLRLVQAVLAAVLVAAALPAHTTAAAPEPVAVMTEQPAAAITVPPGFAATIIARLPEYKQPTSITYGPDGALTSPC